MGQVANVVVIRISVSSGIGWHLTFFQALENLNKGKDILKETDMFLWMHEFARLILVITRLSVENKFQLGEWGNLGLEEAVALPPGP